MRLQELDPHWVGMQPGHAIGVTFLCPCCRKTRIGVLFDEPIHGEYGPDNLIAESLRNAMVAHCRASGFKIWHREGDSFNDLTLTPSIDTSQFQHWHGFVTNGEVR